MASVLSNTEMTPVFNNPPAIWILGVLPLFQCLVLGVASPLPATVVNVVSGFLYWVLAIFPLWWLSHFASKWLLSRIHERWMWLGIALASALVFITINLLGYYYLLEFLFNRWLGVFVAPFDVSPPHWLNLFTQELLFGTLGHVLIWQAVNVSSRFMFGYTLYEAKPKVSAHTAGFLHHVPNSLRDGLLAVQAQEHYIKIHSKESSELILYRFGDALRELTDTAGMQVHRSFWIAEKSVREHKREGGRLLLTLHNGLEVPVSRSFIREVEGSDFLLE